MSHNVEQIVLNAVPIAVSVFVAFVSWSLKRLMHDYEAKLNYLANSFSKVQEKIDVSICDIQKELQQVRIESALFKQTTTEISRYSERVAILEKQAILAESKISAAFAVLSGKRKPWDTPENV